MIVLLTLVAGLLADPAQAPEERFVFPDRIEVPAYLRLPTQQNHREGLRGFNHAYGLLPPERQSDLLEFHRSALEQAGWQVEDEADGQVLASHSNPETGCVQVFLVSFNGMTRIDAAPMLAADYVLYRSDACAFIPIEPTQ
jgi:hypothetical protein